MDRSWRITGLTDFGYDNWCYRNLSGHLLRNQPVGIATQSYCHRPEGATFSLICPQVTNAASAAAAMARITEAVGSGEITIEQGPALAAVVEASRRMIETADLERRIEALEKVNAEQT